MNTKTETGKIGRVSLAVEIDGELFFVELPEDSLRMVVRYAETLSDDSKLHVIDAPKGFKFGTLEDYLERHEGGKL